jgi:hypothetical protein
MCCYGGQLVAQFFEQLGATMLALALLPLGGLRDDLQLAQIAHVALLNCGRSARYPSMLRSEAGQFQPKKHEIKWLSLIFRLTYGGFEAAQLTVRKAQAATTRGAWTSACCTDAFRTAIATALF